MLRFNDIHSAMLFNDVRSAQIRCHSYDVFCDAAGEPAALFAPTPTPIRTQLVMHNADTHTHMHTQTYA